ncbi:MAG: MFS transporter [Coriobacteriia bacterium]|nr:MFS transporter [Coriobacteriia bacterium]
MGKRASKTDDSRRESPREQLWSTTFVLVVISTLCCFMVGQGLNSSTSVYVALYGGTAAYAGVLAAVFSGAAAVVRLLSGPLIDGRGRRIVMLVGFAVLIVGTVGPLFTHDVAPFVVFRILQGAGFSAVTTASATAAADALPASRMGEGIGYYGLGQALSMSVGPALALALVSTDPPENLFIGVTAIAVVGLAMIFLCRYEKHPEMLPEEAVYRRRLEEGESEAARRGTAEALEVTGRAGAAEAAEASETTTSTAQSRMEGQPRRESIASRIFEKHALPGTLPMIVLSPAFGFVIFFVGLYGASLGVENAGLFYTLSAVSMILVRLKSGAFMDRFAPIKILPFALACGLVAFTMLVACGTALDGAPMRDAVFNLSGIVYGFCIGIALPLNQSVAVKNTPPERWGAANALFQLANDVGIGGACVIWGIVNDCFGFPVTICCAMCCIVASYFVARAVYPKES